MNPHQIELTNMWYITRRVAHGRGWRVRLITNNEHAARMAYMQRQAHMRGGAIRLHAPGGDIVLQHVAVRRQSVYSQD